VTSWLPEVPAGDAVLAARRKLEGISSDATTKFSESSQAAVDAGKRATQAHQDFSERVSRIEGRVREIAANRAAEQAKARGPEEIKIGDADREEPPDLPEEYRDIVAHYSVAQPTAAEPEPSVETEPDPTVAAWQSSGVVDDWVPADVLTPPMEKEPPQRETDPQWQVQAGRFGRRKEFEAPKPAAPKPVSTRTERSQPVSDDDYFDNDSWLR
jgi:hypothetical protein